MEINVGDIITVNGKSGKVVELGATGVWVEINGRVEFCDDNDINT